MTSSIAGTSQPFSVTTRATAVDPELHRTADIALKAAAGYWFLVAVIGQWMFVYYILVFYGGAAVHGNFQAWNQVLPHGVAAADSMGNLALAGHLLFAAIITLGGPLQFIPQVRQRFPVFHHWNGRLYLLAASIMGISGLYLGFSGRTVVGDASQHVAIAINGVLILVFAALALRYAVTRRSDIHRRWMLRLFLVVSGVWFFRVGLMFWVGINQGAVGFDFETFRGPFLTFLAFAQYLLPLAVLELYFHARDRAGAAGKFATAGALAVLTVAMGAGIFAATASLWLPRI